VTGFDSSLAAPCVSSGCGRLAVGLAVPAQVCYSWRVRLRAPLAQAPRWSRLSHALALGALVAAVPAGCKLDPECFGTSECPLGRACYRGRCEVPSWIPPDAGPPPRVEAGVLDSGPIVPTWNEDIAPIVLRRCVLCHSDPPNNGAPMPLVQYLDTQARSAFGFYFDRMAERVSNPYRPMPPPGLPSLTPQEVQAIVDWAAAGAPAGDRADAAVLDARALFPDAMTERADVGSGTVDLLDAGFPDPPRPSTPDPRMGAELPTLIQDGHRNLRSPAYFEGSVYFSDLSQNTIWAFDLAAQSERAYRSPSNFSDGIMFLADGRLVTCEYGSRSVTQQVGASTFALASNYLGYQFNGPRDSTAREDGTVYFTDPPDALGPRAPDLPFAGLYRVTPRGEITLEWAVSSTTSEPAPSLGPSGVTLSPDEGVLFVSDRARRTIYAFDVLPDGRLTGRRAFAAVSGFEPDGLVTDDTGNLYVATAEGIAVYDPSGFYWGVLPTPEPPTNLIFGGGDRRTLFFSARSALYAVRMPLPGRLR
jgi:gluconolactonase